MRKAELILPEVSLITSWYHPVRPPASGNELPAMRLALREGVALLDLYFLDHSDIDWYARTACLASPPEEPHEFCARLDGPQLERIARALNDNLTAWYHGRLVGPRPRFTAVATFFPYVSTPEPETRTMAVRALRNTLYLAGRLGCRYVEVVGGSGIPDLTYEGPLGPDRYRDARREALAKTLCEACNPGAEEFAGDPLSGLSLNHVPYVCVELEPGQAFLMNDITEF